MSIQLTHQVERNKRIIALREEGLSVGWVAVRMRAEGWPGVTKNIVVGVLHRAMMSMPASRTDAPVAGYVRGLTTLQRLDALEARFKATIAELAKRSSHFLRPAREPGEGNCLHRRAGPLDYGTGVKEAP
jgi:hypothetical protein